MKLAVSSPGRQEQRIDLEGTASVGRGADNTVVLADPRVSRHHALFHVQRDGGVTLIDLGSVNGTLLNGHRVVLPSRLRDGDVLSIGGTALRVVSESDRPQPSASEDTTTTRVNFSCHDVTVLVVDIRGYTRLSESLPVERTCQLMGTWFRRVDALVHEHHGAVDKFMGDGVLALWVPRAGDPTAAVADALRAALALLRESVHFTDTLDDWPTDIPFRIGIAVNTGLAVLGTIGMAAPRDFTATGDTVNVAFGIEPLTKTFPHPILVTEQTVRHAGDAFRFVPIGPVTVKGRTEPVVVYGLGPET